jgi:hypothetical protein
LCVDLLARGAANDPVCRVHDIEEFFQVLHCRKRKAPGGRGLFGVRLR